MAAAVVTGTLASAESRSTIAASTPPTPPGVGMTLASVLMGTTKATSSGSRATPNALPANHIGATNSAHTGEFEHLQQTGTGAPDPVEQQEEVLDLPLDMVGVDGPAA